MSDRDHMTAAEAERRVDSVYLLGGSPSEKEFALHRWIIAMRREWYQQRSEEKRKAAKAAHA